MGPGLSTLREVDDRDSEPEAGVDGVAGAAGRLVEVTDADAAVLGEKMCIRDRLSSAR